MTRPVFAARILAQAAGRAVRRSPRVLHDAPAQIRGRAVSHGRSLRTASSANERNSGGGWSDARGTLPARWLILPLAGGALLSLAKVQPADPASPSYAAGRGPREEAQRAAEPRRRCI
jgi:hypothetical protein